MTTSTTTAVTAPAGLRHHLSLAVGLDPLVASSVRTLADQLSGNAVMPLVGSGTSFDCGASSAGELAELVHQEYVTREPEASRRPYDLDCKKGDLGPMADALELLADQITVLEAIGMPDEAKWPPRDGFPEHFCSYRVLARLAREGFIDEALTLNYDCGFESGLRAEGFQFARAPATRRIWLDHATVVANAKDNASIERRGSFVLTKAHGCVARYRADVAADPDKQDEHAESIIIRQGQLFDWRGDRWARDILADRSRRHVLMLMGFSGSDPIINVTLHRILEEVAEHAPHAQPRVVVIDRCPDTIALRGLAEEGATGVDPDAVRAVSSDGSSMTAILLALAAELLALRLADAAVDVGYALPSELEHRLPLLIIAAPAMVRCAHVVDPPSAERNFGHAVNVEQATEGAYVPLSSFPRRAARALKARQQLRERFGMVGRETVADTIRDGSFIVSPRSGNAYLPVGLLEEPLVNSRRDARTKAIEALPPLHHAEPFLVGHDEAGELVAVRVPGDYGQKEVPR